MQKGFNYFKVPFLHLLKEFMRRITYHFIDIRQEFFWVKSIECGCDCQDAIRLVHNTLRIYIKHSSTLEINWKSLGWWKRRVFSFRMFKCKLFGWIHQPFSLIYKIIASNNNDYPSHFNRKLLMCLPKLLHMLREKFFLFNHPLQQKIREISLSK